MTRSTQVDEELRAMLMSSWDMGGARPKALVRDAMGLEWIVKFPRAIDTYSRQRVEWANLEIARHAGMTVPETALHELPGGDSALLVKRFDRGNKDHPHHHHYLSAVSLISPPADFNKRQMDSAYGATIFSYARIADVVRKVSENPSRDLQELFARMVLNILVHNTDDHLKNTGFLMDPSSKSFRYRLSPLFDVVTQEGALKHMLHIGPGINNDFPAQNGRVGLLENARAGAGLWGLTSTLVEAIIDRVQASVSHRLRYYVAAGMSEGDIDLVQALVSADAIESTVWHQVCRPGTVGG